MSTQRIRAYGIVQGVGFRPTVVRHAAAAGIAGTVCNKGPYVEVYAQGSDDQVKRFVELLRTQPPRRAAILKLDVKPANDAPAFPDFSIVESERTTGEIFISPDIAICDDCKRELFDPSNRRYLHPFINCTCCGPRMTILESLPYDRERTSMRVFPLCPECAREYHDPASRRYDAQPVCCNGCGPQAYLVDRAERGQAAISEARRIIADGGVVAVKGIGGFHLCCDATNQKAVALLRKRKRRSAKPFAVMARNLNAARREVIATPAAERILTGHQKPILLLPKRLAKAGGSPKGAADLRIPQGADPAGAANLAGRPRVCEAVAPGNPKLGVVLPYAPLHLLLFDYSDEVRMPDVLVMTSANESGAPICRDDDEARSELGSLCDAILSHDRKIRVRADDTVMDLFENRPYMVRRSRGWAPLPFVLSQDLGVRVLATGGELKNSFCLASGDRCYPSPYVGDLEDVRTVRALEETIGRFQDLLEFEPDVVACDLHPKYNATLVARELAVQHGLPIVPVQHHFAHVASCMAENDVANDERVIGVSFDGTGYGEDGTIWGGEVLLASYDGYDRFCHITPFAQAGGDLSAREGWRVAVGMLAGMRHAHDVPKLAQALGLCSAAEARVVCAMVARGVNSVTSTSAGRLFDAVSAVLGIRRASSFEGEAATQLQFAAERWLYGHALGASAQGLRSLEYAGESFRAHFSTGELFAWVVERRLAGADACELAYAFHVGLANFVLDACLRARAATGVNVVALTGGCYQNVLLLEMSVQRLRKQGFRVLTHSLVPPNDGGIALGQAVVAARRAKRTKGV